MNQAERVIEAFGGSRNLEIALWKIGKPRDRVSIYRWTCDKASGGTGGYVPSSAWDDIFAAAKAEGVILTDDITSPRCS